MNKSRRHGSFHCRGNGFKELKLKRLKLLIYIYKLPSSITVTTGIGMHRHVMRLKCIVMIERLAAELALE